MARHSASRARRDNGRGRRDDVPWGWLLGGLAAVGGAAWWLMQIRVGDRVRVDLTKAVGTTTAAFPPGSAIATLRVTGTTDTDIQGTVESVQNQNGQAVQLPVAVPLALTVPRASVLGKV